MIDQNNTIKSVSEQTGLSIDTLRWYERIGLIGPVERLENGHRRYNDADLERIRFLKHLRATGMPVSEMLHYIELYREGDSTTEERLRILQDHRQDVLRQREELEATLAAIDRKIEMYTQSISEPADTHMEEQEKHEYKQRDAV